MDISNLKFGLIFITTLAALDKNQSKPGRRTFNVFLKGKYQIEVNL
jgi:hypothetical protein